MKKFLSQSFGYIVADAVVIFGISFLCFLGALDNSAFKESIHAILIYCASLSFLSCVLFSLSKQYRRVFTNFGIDDCIRLGIASLVVGIASLICLIFIKPLNFKPQYIVVWFLGLIAIMFVLTTIRTFPRLINMFKVYFKSKSRIRTMVIGAGLASKIVIDDTKTNPDNKNKIVVLVDDDKNKINTYVGNIPVQGPIKNVLKLIKKYNVEQVIIAIANLKADRLHEIVGYLQTANVRVMRMPLLTEMDGPNDIHIINVDIDELLNRDPIELDNTQVRGMLEDQTVLVTGAGGSIGSELTRQIFRAHPKQLIIFDIYENSTYDIQQELFAKIRRKNITDTKLITLIGSTYNEKRVEQIFKKYKPDYVYHAAAYKHVPLMEDSPAEAIRTNVIGTYNVAKMADKYGVKKMVLVSTDKAVRPTNTMGATKRFAETIIQYFSEKSKNTAYAAVRFGNVLGSNGSVVPLFKKQIEQGGPITLTHKDIIRYFMTIPEAVSLILQCGLYAEGGEIFILDMGKPVKIYDLAANLIRQAGLVPEKDIKIIETGLRPGEKLFEELLLDKATQKKTANERIFIEEMEPIQPIEEEIKTISKAFDLEESNDVKKLLKSIITTYSIDEGK